MPRKNRTPTLSIPAQQLRTNRKSKGPRPSIRPSGPAPAPPKSRGRGRKSKGLLSTALDVGETIAGVLPGAIRGVRNLFNLKEASFATPASFAVVQNNITQMLPQERITHPTLGISGYRISGSQPLTNVVPWIGIPITTPPTPPQFFAGGTATIGGAASNYIWLNPIALGGPLSLHGFLNDRYVIRMLKVKFTTYQTTSQVGVACLAIEKDPLNLMGTTFDSARSVTPNVTFPYRIPKAELDYIYDGPDLYYTDASAEGIGSVGAAQRQDVQGVLEGFDPILPIDRTIMGFLDIEYVVDFFDPIPPSTLVGVTKEERAALQVLRAEFRNRDKAMLEPAKTDPKPGWDYLRSLIPEESKDDEPPPQLESRVENSPSPQIASSAAAASQSTPSSSASVRPSSPVRPFR